MHAAAHSSQRAVLYDLRENMKQPSFRQHHLTVMVLFETLV
jgi:hypothetical protein